MMLAGLRVPDSDVLELARSLRDAELGATAETLERAYETEVVAVLALTIADREAILRALDDAGRSPPPLRNDPVPRIGVTWVMST